MNSSSKYYVTSVVCTESEFPIIQQTLQVFPLVQGAVTYDKGKARYCLDFESIDSSEVKTLIDQIKNTIDLVLLQLRSGE